MARVQHKAIARLRGRAEPRQDILDRILEINPTYRVSWLPEGVHQKDHQGKDYFRPAMWRIYELNENPIRRAAGFARLQRFEKWEKAKQAENIGLVYDAQDWMDGLHLVAEYSEQFFGNEQMFDDLKRYELELAPFRGDVKKAQDDDANRDALDEVDVNPEFAEMVRETAKDWYNLVKGNASVAVATSLRKDT